MLQNEGGEFVFYDNFLALCTQRTVTPSAVMRAIGLNKSSASYWKKGSIPSTETLQKLADYFDVSVDYLLSGGEQITQTHLANGVHIYKNTIPFKVIEPFLADSSLNSCNIAYQDEYLLIAVDENAAVKPGELEKIIDAYAPYREKQIDVQPTDPNKKALLEIIDSMSESQLRLMLAKMMQIMAEQPETAPQSTPAPQEGQSTTPPPDAPETPPEGK